MIGKQTGFYWSKKNIIKTESRLPFFYTVSKHGITNIFNSPRRIFNASTQVCILIC